MFQFRTLISVLLLAVISCTKSESTAPPNNNGNGGNNNGGNNNGNGNNNATDTFTTYLIKAGKNYCEGNSYPLSSIKSLRFKAIFDSSCIYTNVNPVNQADINKLYGFADSNVFHQINSARFGWNWMNGAMHIHAYCYVSTVRMYKELGTVPLNTEVDCSIDVVPGNYIFTLNGKRDTMLRASQDTVAVGYKLYPYFGGDETAPHDVRIMIKELQ